MCKMKTKICTKCKIEKPLSDFHKRSKSKDGHAYRCKTCRNPGKKKYAMTDEKKKEKHKLRERELRKKYPERYMLYAAKRNSKNKNIEFTLKLHDINIPDYCPVLGIEINKNMTYTNYNSPSIDRIDNDKGYTPDNIVIVCDRVNRLKKDAKIEELKQILKYMKGEI